MIYKAEYVITMDGPPIRDGAVRISGKRIVGAGPAKAFRRRKDEEVREFKDAILMPGLINCHSHLELGGTRSMFPKQESFAMWLARLLKYKASAGEQDYLHAIRLGVLECIRTGTTTVFDTGNSGATLTALPYENIRSLPVFEFAGLNPETGLSRFTKQMGLLSALNSLPTDERCRPAFSAHSLFTCSEELIRAVAERIGDFDAPFTMHLAESAEEWEYFSKGTGRLADRYRRVFPSHRRSMIRDPFHRLLENGLLPDGSLLAHCNFMQDDWTGPMVRKNISIATCPRSSAFFGHPPFPYELCYNHGINVCLGTDGLASNENLNMFEEMAEFKNMYPQMECSHILEMATTRAAQALRKEGELGKLRKGFLADMIAITLDHDPGYDLYDEIVCEEHETILSVIDGTEVMI